MSSILVSYFVLDHLTFDSKNVKLLINDIIEYGDQPEKIELKQQLIGFFSF